jgi:hypothetical protein
VKLAWLLTLNLLVSLAANSTEYSNSFLKFSMPDGWYCNLEGAEFVCHSQQPNDAKRASIVFVGKLIGPQDSLLRYRQYLSSPLRSADPTQRGPSTIISPPREYPIKGRTWIDALHKGSEVRDYYTRYLGTVAGQLAVMVTLSVRASDYSTYGPLVFKIADSLMLSEKYKNYLNNSASPSSGDPLAPGISGPSGAETIGPPEGGFFIDPYKGPNGPSRKASRWKALLFVLGVVSAVVAGYLLWSSRKK